VFDELTTTMLTALVPYGHASAIKNKKSSECPEGTNAASRRGARSVDHTMKLKRTDMLEFLVAGVSPL
jgi:hypothetical protein